MFDTNLTRAKTGDLTTGGPFGKDDGLDPQTPPGRDTFGPATPEPEEDMALTPEACTPEALTLELLVSTVALAGGGKRGCFGAKEKL